MPENETVSHSEIGTYGKRDSGKLAYELRDLLADHDRIEVWSDGDELLASADGDAWIHEFETDNRGVYVGGEQVLPEDVVEVVAYDEDDDSENEA